MEWNRVHFREIFIAGLPTLTSGSLLVPKWATIKSTAVFTAFTNPNIEENRKKRDYCYLFNHHQQQQQHLLSALKRPFLNLPPRCRAPAQTTSPLFCVRSTEMWDCEEEEQEDEDDVEASGERQNSSGGFSVREK